MEYNAWMYIWYFLSFLRFPSLKGNILTKILKSTYNGTSLRISILRKRISILRKNWLIKLLFKNGRTSMLVFLPSHEDSDPYLQTLFKDLSYVPMRTLLTSLKETELVLSIPRFSIENKLDLRSSLMRVSIKT